MLEVSRLTPQKRHNGARVISESKSAALFGSHRCQIQVNDDNDLFFQPLFWFRAPETATFLPCLTSIPTGNRFTVAHVLHRISRMSAQALAPFLLGLTMVSLLVLPGMRSVSQRLQMECLTAGDSRICDLRDTPRSCISSRVVSDESGGDILAWSSPAGVVVVTFAGALCVRFLGTAVVSPALAKYDAAWWRKESLEWRCCCGTLPARLVFSFAMVMVWWHWNLGCCYRPMIN